MYEKINYRNKGKQLLLLLALCILWNGCKTTTVGETPVSKDIIGSWKGCDGRVITFQNEGNGEIVGRYTKLGNLGQYGFEESEIGYKVSQQQPGIYYGSVKWRSSNQNVSWKTITITIVGNSYEDNGSDSCAKEMDRITTKQNSGNRSTPGL